MAISVSRITKSYGAQKALDDISFEIGSGEVVGFLGPNGAGKSTMMKILTCFIPPDSGDAMVCGHGIHADSIAVRRSIGYLPENNPVYTDMYVREYLEFVAGVHGLKRPGARVHEMIGAVGLGNEQHKLIGALSKGYRQRVGLAQAMIHDPQVLILDEPTSGLDPNQLDGIRSLIKHLGREKTVMLSTHIMQEVEAICDRVIILDKGRLVADDKASDLRGTMGRKQVLEVEFDRPVQANLLTCIPGVLHARHGEGHFWHLAHEAHIDVRPEVFQFAVDKGLKVLGLRRSERGLEEVFKELTKGS